MFPSSQMDINKICCDRSTCPKRRQQRGDSSLQASSVEEIDRKVDEPISRHKIDKETQMSHSMTSTSSEKNHVPAKNSEKSSEAYFDRNNQNISSCRNKFCPSNSSQTSQTESQVCAVMLKCPFSLVANCCRKCGRLQQSNYNTTTTSSIPKSPKQECICKKLDITSSSSSSLTSEHFPVKLSLKSNSIERKLRVPKMKYQTQQAKPIFVTSTAPRPERLQPHPIENSLNAEEFFSCCSEDSDSDSICKTDSYEKSHCSCKRPKSDKNSVILELLQEVVHLINKDNPIRDEALRITQVTPSSLDEKSSKITTQEYEIKVESKQEDSKPPLVPQFTPSTWPPPCLCCTYGMNLSQVQPFQMPMVQPFNLVSPVPQIPEPFVYERTEDSFKDCSSGNGSLLTAGNIQDNLCCICSDITDVCPKHGPVKKLLEKADLPCPRLVAEEGQDICIISTEQQQSNILHEQIKIKSDSSDKPSDKELYSRYVEMKITDDLERVVLDDGDEGKTNINLSPKEIEEDVDEELHPRYADTKLIDPVDSIEPSPDCLLVYDDEEPEQAEDIIDVDEEIQPIYVEQITFEPGEKYEPSPDCLMEYDDEDPSWPDLIGNVLENLETTEYLQLPTKPIEKQETSAKIVAPEDGEPTEEPDKPKETESIEQTPSTELDITSQSRPIEIVETPLVTAEESSPYIVDASPTSGRNIYNFLPEIDRTNVGEPKQIIRYNESEEEFDSYYDEEQSELLVHDEYELAKEKLHESRKRKKSDVDRIPSTNMVLATIKQLEVEGSPEEMKFFIDSLIMDFEAMEYARHKSQFEKNICKSISGLCARDSFPVTITDVTDLGASSLYVKWIIHDCYGIGGYEIYTDGYLTNRFYNSKHEAAVITHVDVTLPHKIALVAQPSADDESIKLMCNITKDKNKPKSLPWKTDAKKERKSCAALWTPSIFLYDPVTCKAIAATPIMRDNF